MELHSDRVRDAVGHYCRFARELVVPSDGTVQVLDALVSRGHALGLLSNAHDDIARAFADSELAGRFAAVTFSCQIGWRKPDPKAYAAVVDALDAPSKVMFVGDGSDNELTGAAMAGLHPVLLRGDTTDAYDSDRPEVAAWSGPSIDKLEDLPDRLLSGR